MKTITTRVDELEQQVRLRQPARRRLSKEEIAQHLGYFLEHTSPEEMERLRRYTPTEAERQALKCGVSERVSDDARRHRIIELDDNARQHLEAAK